MSFFVDDGPSRFHCVGWSHVDDLEQAQFRYFDNRQECKEFAQKCTDRGMAYVWMAEKGTYANQGFTRVTDWMYWWWNKAAQDGDAGPLPELGSGVPEERSWSYRVAYQSSDPAR
jgi:hypothetical protein